MRAWWVAAMVLVACREPAPALEAGGDVTCEAGPPRFPTLFPVAVNGPAYEVPSGVAFGSTIWRLESGRLRSRAAGLEVSLTGWSGADAIISDRHTIKLVVGDALVDCAVSLDADVTSVALTPTHAWWFSSTTLDTTVFRAERFAQGCGEPQVFVHENTSSENFTVSPDGIAFTRTEQGRVELVFISNAGARSTAVLAMRSFFDFCSTSAGLALVGTSGVHRVSASGVVTPLHTLSGLLVASQCAGDQLVLALRTTGGTTLERLDVNGVVLESRFIPYEVTDVGSSWVVADGLLRAWDGSLLGADARHLQHVWANGNTVLVSQFPGYYLRWDGTDWARAQPSPAREVPDGRGGVLTFSQQNLQLALESHGAPVISWKDQSYNWPEYRMRLLFSDVCSGDLIVEIVSSSGPRWLAVRHHGAWHLKGRPGGGSVTMEGDRVRVGVDRANDAVWTIGAETWVDAPSQWRMTPDERTLFAVGDRLAMQEGDSVVVLHNAPTPGYTKLANARLLGAVAPFIFIERDGVLTAVRVN